MVAEITVNNTEEFQELVDNKDIRIARAIVEGILENIGTKKKHVHVLSVNCLEEASTFDITLDRKYFVETLQENLKYYVEQELYEDCSKIVEAINTLKEKENTHGSKSENKHNKGVY